MKLKLLFVIAAAGLLLRIFYVSTLPEETAFPDSERYNVIAGELLRGEGFKSPLTAPLYPLFLAGVYSVFGRSFFAVRASQAFLGALSILIVFFLTEQISSKRAGIIAASIFAVYPFFIFFSGLLLTETLFIFILLGFILFLGRLLKNPTGRNALAAGIAGGVSVLIKPAMFYFIFISLIYYLAARRNKKIAIGFCVLTAAFLITISPWPLYNLARHGRPDLLPASSITLYESFNPEATGGPAIHLIRWTREMRRMDGDELERYFRAEALRFIKENPARAVHLALIKQARFWSPVPNFSEYRNIRYGLISFFSYVPVLILCLWMVFSNRKNWNVFSHLCLPVIFFALLHAVMVGSIRYRVPVDPFIIILAATKIDQLARNRSILNQSCPDL